MGVFFIDTSTGTVATATQLLDAGLTAPGAAPPRPWLEIRATRDASTMWYEVLRKQERGIFIGTLVLRHSTHHASLLEQGWETVEIADIGVSDAA